MFFSKVYTIIAFIFYRQYRFQNSKETFVRIFKQQYLIYLIKKISNAVIHILLAKVLRYNYLHKTIETWQKKNTNNGPDDTLMS